MAAQKKKAGRPKQNGEKMTSVSLPVTTSRALQMEKLKRGYPSVDAMLKAELIRP